MHVRGRRCPRADLRPSAALPSFGTSLQFDTPTLDALAKAWSEAGKSVCHLNMASNTLQPWEPMIEVMRAAQTLAPITYCVLPTVSSRVEEPISPSTRRRGSHTSLMELKHICARPYFSHEPNKHAHTPMCALLHRSPLPWTRLLAGCSATFSSRLLECVG